MLRNNRAYLMTSFGLQLTNAHERNWFWYLLTYCPSIS